MEAEEKVPTPLPWESLDIFEVAGISAGLTPNSTSQQWRAAQAELEDLRKRLHTRLENQSQRPQPPNFPPPPQPPQPPPLPTLQGLDKDDKRFLMQSYNAAWKNYENELANYHANYERKLALHSANCAAMQANYERELELYEREQTSVANLEEQVGEAHGRARTLSEAINNPAKRSRVDRGTTNFLVDIKKNMPSIPDHQDLCAYMGKQEPLAAKIPISEQFCVELRSYNDQWRDFLAQNAIIDDESPSVEIEDWLKRFATGHERGGTTELEVEPLQNALIDIFSILGLAQKRNATSKGFTNEAGNPTRPDISCLSECGISVFHGETKAGQDPYAALEAARKDLQAKTSSALWNSFPGLKYMVVVATAGSAGKLVVEFNVIKREGNTLEPFWGPRDICDLGNRPAAALVVLKLLAFLQCMLDILEPTFARTGFSFTRWKHLETGVSQRVYPVTSCDPFVVKQWKFPSRDQCEAFKTHLESLHAELDDTNDGPWQKFWLPPRIASGPDRHTLTASFKPYGRRIMKWTEEDVLQLLTELLAALRQLHELGIVHNDIRLENVIKHDGRFLLIDFDDAAIMDDNGRVPAVAHLLKENHAPNIHEEHGAEVDVWGLGFTVWRAAEQIQPTKCAALIEFAKWMMGKYQECSLDEVSAGFSAVREKLVLDPSSEDNTAGDASNLVA